MVKLDTSLVCCVVLIPYMEIKLSEVFEKYTDSGVGSVCFWMCGYEWYVCRIKIVLLVCRTEHSQEWRGLKEVLPAL